MKNILNKIGNAIKFVWGHLSTRIWLIATLSLLLLMVISNIALTHPFISNTMSSIFGGETYKLVEGDPNKYQYFTTDYTDKDSSKSAADKFNETIAEEGMILLKNNNSTLPLATPKSPTPAANNLKVSVFGKNSVNLVYGGSGSSEADSSKSVTIQSSLEAAGFDVNPTLTEFYKNDSKSGSGRPSSPNMGSILTGFPIGETPIGSYESVQSSYSSYNDAAICVISRIGGEGYDLPRTMFWNGRNFTSWSTKESSRKVIDGAAAWDSHYLELDTYELAMIEEAKKCSQNVIVVVNASQSMELGEIQNDTGVDSIVWIGGPGGSGINALGRILNGTVNPSGRTVDTFVNDLKDDPTWENFGNNLSGGGNAYINEKGVTQSKYSVDYEEGIYVGYRYYETRGVTEDDNWGWYDSKVTYPLGYGLSYTTFEYNITNSTALSSTELTKNSNVRVNVEVQNTGEVAGKETVQIYLKAPYFENGIEKSHVILAGFAKTDLIQPNGKDTVQIDIPAYYFASYDYNDANSNNFKGYEIEAGEYTLFAAKNSNDHRNENVEKVLFNQTQSVRIDTDPHTGEKVENQFDFVDGGLNYMSRTDFAGTYPTQPTESDLKVSEAFLNSLNYDADDTGKPWETDIMPDQAKRSKSIEDIQLYELISKDYNDELWDEFMDQLTVSDMSMLIGTGIYQTSSLGNIGKPRSISVDGPVGITAFMGEPAVYGTASYVSGTLLSATYNVVLAQGFGNMIGEEALVGDQRTENGQTYSSWYAPGVNIHRSAFGGRNWEYYSEDGTLSGIMAAYVIAGAKERGLVTYIKHFALNDQETNRCDGVSTWANEQSIREIYLRAFEIAIKGDIIVDANGDMKTFTYGPNDEFTAEYGGSHGVMSSFNSLGHVWAGGSYELLTEVLRNEWGFEGSVITDFNLYSHMPADQMVRAGGDLNLSQYKAPTVSTKDATQVTVIRNAAKNILFSLTKSSMMNGYGDGVVYKRVLPQWETTMYLIDAAVIVALGATGALLIVKASKKGKEEN